MSNKHNDKTNKLLEQAAEQWVNIVFAHIQSNQNIHKQNQQANTKKGNNYEKRTD